MPGWKKRIMIGGWLVMAAACCLAATIRCVVCGRAVPPHYLVYE